VVELDGGADAPREGLAEREEARKAMSSSKCKCRRPQRPGWGGTEGDQIEEAMDH
jgi:hypothetical protein